MQSSTKKETTGETVTVYSDYRKHSLVETDDWQLVNKSESDDDSIEILEEIAIDLEESESNGHGVSKTLSPDFYEKVAKILSPSSIVPTSVSGLVLLNSQYEDTESDNNSIEFPSPDYDEINAKILPLSSNAPTSASSLALRNPDADVQESESDDDSFEIIRPRTPSPEYEEMIVKIKSSKSNSSTITRGNGLLNHGFVDGKLMGIEFEIEVENEVRSFEDEGIKGFLEFKVPQEKIVDDEIQEAVRTYRYKFCRAPKMNENERFVASGTYYKIFYSFFIGILVSLIIQQYKNCIPDHVLDALFNLKLNATDMLDLPFMFSHPNSFAHELSSSNYSSEGADDEDFLARLRNDIEKRKNDSDRIFEQQLNLLKHVQPWNENVFVLNFSEFMLQSTQENCTSQPDTPVESCDTDITNVQLPLICQNDSVILVLLNNDSVISIYDVIQKFWNKTEMSIQNSITEALKTFNKSINYDNGAEDNFVSDLDDKNDNLIDAKFSEETNVEDEGINRNEKRQTSENVESREQNRVSEEWTSTLITVSKKILENDWLKNFFAKNKAKVDVDDSQKGSLFPEEWSQSLTTLRENILEKAKNVYVNVKSQIVGVRGSKNAESPVVDQKKDNLASKKSSLLFTVIREKILDNDLFKNFLVEHEAGISDEGDSKMVDVETKDKIDESQFRGDWLMKLNKGREEFRDKAGKEKRRASVNGDWLSKLGKAREKFRLENMKVYKTSFEKASKKFKNKLKIHVKKLKHHLKDISENVAKKYDDLKVKFKTAFY